VDNPAPVDDASGSALARPTVPADRERPGTEEDDVKVDIATLQSMAGQCRAEAAESTARHTHLSSSINSSVLDGWTDSQAAVQFSELYEQWRLSAQGVSDALNGMGGLLTSVASSYQQHEAEMAARIGAMI
jgi:WXG100 family type VII secretion target